MIFASSVTPDIIASTSPAIIWLYSLSNVQLCALVLAIFVGVAVVGQQTVQVVRHRRKINGNHNEIVAQFLSAAGVFFGIALGLVAVSVWQSFEQIDGNVTREAAKLATLYRAVHGLPPAVREPIAAKLRAYTKNEIEVTWPLQRKGENPPSNTLLGVDIRLALSSFEPKSIGEGAVQSEALRLLDDMVEFRQLRLYSVLSSGLAPTLWGVILGGSFLTLAFTWFLVAQSQFMHLLLSICLAVLLGLLVFLVVAMDHPYLGQYSVSADAFQVTLDRMMQ
jgi:hypothetical protein